MAMKEMKLTKEGLENLQNELDYLITVKRKEVSDKIKTARGFGDLSENSEYDEAKNEHAMVEARIQQLQTVLKHVVVVDESELSSDTVGIGSTVRVLCTKNNREDTYKIVGSTESDPMKKRISDESPVGKALIGHKVGEVVEAEAPNGVIAYEILEISK